MSLNDDALQYHSRGRKGKIEVVPSKPVSTQADLSLAYSPGVAEPCRMIAEKDELVFEYTIKGNLVGVISNGTAVLGLGDIGPHAAKPVMEGKGILFKKFADIDVFDLELNSKDPDEIIRTCEILAPTFGGINLEDIKAPECFRIEEELKKRLSIPVFHDDQHGTAVISGAAFLNALEVVDKKIEDVKIVFCGGGAAAIACAQLYLGLGARRENILMSDSKGIIYKGRTEGMNPYKERFAADTKCRTLADALQGADAFVGVSVANCVSEEMVRSMAKNPIIFAMANPDPEVLPETVLKVRSDAIMATGRSDYPNQVNNVLGFPFIFRGALDVHATQINEEMKMAAVKALAQLAKEQVPENVSRAYGNNRFTFGRDYLIPKPFDQRVLLWVAPAVAEAAMKSGVARREIDLRTYREHLETLLGSSYMIMRGIKNRVRQDGATRPKTKIAFPEGESTKILQAARVVRIEGIAEPILLGDRERISANVKLLGLEKDLAGVEIIHPSQSEDYEGFAQKLFEKRFRKGMTQSVARSLMRQPNFYGSMLVDLGRADGLLTGLTMPYADALHAPLEVIGCRAGSRLAGVYLVIAKKQLYWFADTTVNIDPSAEEIAEIAISTAKIAESFTGVKPRIAMLSFSNFGSNRHAKAQKMRRAAELVREAAPQFEVDGEMQADTALAPVISEESYPFSRVKGNANVLVFPNLEAGNIAYKLMAKMGQADTIGPILTGMKKPVHVLQTSSDVNDIVNMAAVIAMEALFAGKT